jgi:outer membrane protein assembly factor BamB
VADTVASLSPSKLSGTWTGTLSHDGETRLIGLRLETTEAGRLAVTFSNPAIDVWDYPIGEATIEADGIRIGRTFVLAYDSTADALAGTIPAALVPVYKMAVTFRRGTLERRQRPALSAAITTPVWTFDAGAPVWADALFDGGLVYAGADDGSLHALDAATGRPRWHFRAGGAIRARPTLSGDDLFLHADDGFLYRLRAADGKQRWKVPVESKPIHRLPIGDPNSRFADFASAAVVDSGRLYVGTNDGHVLGLDVGSGKRIWDFGAGDTVQATPVVNSRRVYFGSFDGNVYALDSTSGALLWKHDTGAPVVSTAALHDGRVIVGSRSYDLLALDAQTGTPAWTRYIWFSWIESPAAVADGTVYVGSSDAAKLFALDARTGDSRWELDVLGWAWGQAAVSATRVFAGTAGVGQYLVKHQGGVLAVDRATGAPLWRFPVAGPSDGSVHGFAASPALGQGLVFIGGLDARVYAFRQ